MESSTETLLFDLSCWRDPLDLDFNLDVILKLRVSGSTTDLLQSSQKNGKTARRRESSAFCILMPQQNRGRPTFHPPGDHDDLSRRMSRQDVAAHDEHLVGDFERRGDLFHRGATSYEITNKSSH
jgi:hypothetical protein